LLEGLRDREADLLARGNLDRLSRLRVPSHAGLHLAEPEDAQPRDLDGLALLDALRDGVDQTIEDLVALLTADPTCFCEFRHQLRLRHRSTSIPGDNEPERSRRNALYYGSRMASVKKTRANQGLARYSLTRGGPPRAQGKQGGRWGGRPGTTGGTIARAVGQRRGSIAKLHDHGLGGAWSRCRIGAEIAPLVASELQSCEKPQVEAVHTTITMPVNGVREVLDRVISAYEEIDRRFATSGGLSRLLALYEQLQRELERVSYEEIDRMTGDIKGVIETLLTMDYELRRVNNLKLAFDAKQPGS